MGDEDSQKGKEEKNEGIDLLEKLNEKISGIESDIGDFKDRYVGETFYITYPASDGVETVTYASTNPRLEIDFYTGTVKMPDGTKYQYPNTSATSEPLKNYEERIEEKIGWLRSLEIFADHDVAFSLDEKSAKTMCYGGRTRVLLHQEFKKVIVELKESTESTIVAISASTHPEGVIRIDSSGFRTRPMTTLTWASVTQNTTDNAPDPDTEIDIGHARSIAIQVDTTLTANASGDIDINVETTPDGTNWDSTPYTSTNIGDNAIKTFLVAPGPRRMRLRLDENNSGAGAATCNVFVRE